MTEPFDSFGSRPDYSKQGDISSNGRRDPSAFNEFVESPAYEARDKAGVPVFDPLKAPPYQQQDFDPSKAKEPEDDERGRHPIERNPAGATGSRSVSRSRKEESPVRGRRPQNIDSASSGAPLERIQSPHRAMGARSGSINRGSQRSPSTTR